MVKKIAMNSLVAISACALIGCGSGSSGSAVVAGTSTSDTLFDDNRLDSHYGDRVFYPEGDVPRLRRRDQNAWHLHEVDVRIVHPEASYNQLLAARGELDAVIREFVPLAVQQMIRNSEFLGNGGAYDDLGRNTVNGQFSQALAESVVLYGDNGDISGLETPTSLVGVFYQVPGGGEILVFVGGMEVASNKISIQIGQQYDTRRYPLGYNVKYAYDRGVVAADGREFSQTFYTKLGLTPVINKQSLLEGGLDAGNAQDWDADFAVTVAMTEAVRQLITGNVN